MNIYLHIEILVRELDSNLLLACLAAKRGHQVYISNLSDLDTGLKLGLISPGIFHTKSLTPNNNKIKKHQILKDKGFLITSIDQEANLSDHGYDSFAKTRYSEKSIDQASAVFCWGQEDSESIKKFYPKYSPKIFMTGSPRVDLCKPTFQSYWSKPKGLSEKPFLLVSSNMGLTDYTSWSHRIKFLRDAGYVERDPGAIKREFTMRSDDYKRSYALIEALTFIAKNNHNKFDIIFRPHPTEDTNGWKFLLKGIPNIKVIREGAINKWVNNAFAVLHSGCTTALEATVSKKPVITFDPFKPTLLLGQLANQLGYRVETLEDLLKISNMLFDNHSKPIDKNFFDKDLKKIASKLDIDKDKLASEKIINIWESLSNEKNIKSPNLGKLKLVFQIKEFRDNIGKQLKKFFPKNFDRFRDDTKYSYIKRDDVINRVQKLRNILKIEEEIECELISNRVILIRKS